MPDVDVDFDDRRRPEVIRYVTEKYGDDRVAQIVTYGTIKAKQALKDSARVLGMPFSRRRASHQGDAARDHGQGHLARRHRHRGIRALQGGRRLPRPHRHRRRGGESVRDGARDREPQAPVGRARCRRHHVGRAADRRTAADEARGRRRDHHPVRPTAARGPRPAQDGLPRTAQPDGDPGCAELHRAQHRRSARDRAARPRRRSGHVRPAVPRRDARACSSSTAGRCGRCSSSSSRPISRTSPPSSRSTGRARWAWDRTPSTRCARTAWSRSTRSIRSSPSRSGRSWTRPSG